MGVNSDSVKLVVKVFSLLGLVVSIALYLILKPLSVGEVIKIIKFALLVVVLFGVIFTIDGKLPNNELGYLVNDITFYMFIIAGVTVFTSIILTLIYLVQRI